MLGGTNTTRLTKRREATRSEILDAAWESARERGLAQITLSDIAARVGMQAPSLYSHFESKNAIYDAMFAQAWAACLALMRSEEQHLPTSCRGTLRVYARSFFEFSVSDLARHQLMNQRTIPGFEPSADSYAPAVEVLEAVRTRLTSLGHMSNEDVDLFIALVGGLIDAQLANDPGGDRWARLVDRAATMFADHLGLPPETSGDQR
jgi:AcrR family transcriptional regulator